jgi:hypothetical protein
VPDPPITIQENAALPDEHAAAWPGRPEDAILGALVQIALARYALRLAKQFGIDRGRKRVRNSQLQRLLSRSFSTRFG